jgi:Holliday junction resolvase-like predicted endonuclease
MHKKELGRWGESCLDQWMLVKKWNVMHRNLYIRNGEIDRVYAFWNESLQESKICVAEVKTNLIYTKKEIQNIFTEVGFKRYFKQRQIQNLYRFAETLQAQRQEKNIQNVHFFLRFFLILKFGKKIDLQSDDLENNSGIKICHQSLDHLIFSVEPEFTQFNARKSLLQTRI